MHRETARHGSVLILVAGMAALLLTMAVSVLVSLRGMAGPSTMAIAEAQNRITLGSALFFLQETSRMGWGNGPGEHSYGWTDVRDGSAGPNGPRDASGNIPKQWTAGTFPAEGTVFRGDMFAWETTPYAIRQDIAPNPVRLTDSDADQAAWAAEISKATPAAGADIPTRTDAFKPYWQRALNQIETIGLGPYAVQPVKDTFAAFAAGDKTARLESVGLTWFRIYREQDSDRNGDGSPWYDTVPHAGHGTFVITVGAGSSRGFRFWDSTDYLNGRTSLPAGISARSAAIEPLTAKDSGLFYSETAFKSVRASERIAWYRVCWSASSSAGLESLINGLSRGELRQRSLQHIFNRKPFTRDTNTTPHYGGAIRWIQRLEREPASW